MKSVPAKLVNAVFRRVLAQDLTPSLEQQLVLVGLDVSKPAEGDTDKAVWDKSIETTARALFANEPSALRALGRHVVVSLDSRKLIKGPWLSMARLLGVKRALKRAAQSTDAGFPITFALKEVSTQAVEVTSSESAQPEFLAGLLEGLVLLLKGREPKVVVSSVQPANAVFAIEWR
jgi:uncharacterized protein (TIGR02265 family)